MVEWVIKYGVLFVVFVFIVFFLFEVVCVLRLNVLNYLLVGVVLCLFFFGLLVLLEVMGFEKVYFGVVLVLMVLIGLYSWWVLWSVLWVWLVSGMFGGVYVYLFFVLWMEDMLLVVGMVGLFVVFVVVMYVMCGLWMGIVEVEIEVDGGGVKGVFVV